MIYGYARVSSKTQLEGNGLEQQKQELLKAGVKQENIVFEQYTGTTTNRPKFTKLIDVMQYGDVLIVTKLDRFARSTSEGMNIMQHLLNKGVEVKILNFGGLKDGFTSTNKLMFQIFLAFAEYERDMIVQRTQEGKAIAKQNPNFREGRPKKYTPKQIANALNMLKTQSYNEVAEITGISKSTLVRAVRKSRAIS